MTTTLGSECRTLFSKDFLLVALFCLSGLALEGGILSPYQRPIPEKKLAIGDGKTALEIELLLDHPYIPDHEQIVPNHLLIIICTVVPLGTMCIGILIWQKPGDIAFLKGFALAVTCMLLTVNFVKDYVGYLRPYFYQECGFDEATGECLHDKADAHKSFPSGHSSLSFCSMLFTSLYLMGKLTSGPRTVELPCLGKMDITNLLILAGLSPLALAFWIAASRVRENDHHPADVVGGGTVGSAWAVLWYFRYYPSIFAPDAGSPRLGASDSESESDLAMAELDNGGRAYEDQLEQEA